MGRDVTSVTLDGIVSRFVIDHSVYVLLSNVRLMLPVLACHKFIFVTHNVPCCLFMAGDVSKFWAISALSSRWQAMRQFGVGSVQLISAGGCVAWGTRVKSWNILMFFLSCSVRDCGFRETFRRDETDAGISICVPRV
jgi:hypothetical protein